MSEAAPGGIEIRELDTVEQIHLASAVLAEVWGGDRSGMPPNLLRALAYSGNYAVGLYDGDRMIGASVAFFGPPASRSMHSHITGVLPGYRSQGLGRLLKEHQRGWALAREVGHITWTFDPLVARNAHFNLLVLGAKVTDYLVNQYGAMDDGVNRGDESDRLMVSWALAAARPRNPHDDRVVATVAVPRDIETMRTEAPAEAEHWRREVRGEFQRLMGEGLVVAGFRDEPGYLFVRA
ncbi:GNAT family N-acetyltransferase [Microbacterium fluvii]|uniref:GNAT family N-acetyltransferase n=1 Tax=Microbacterium fluvii TaxID=415215 RepID=A0ABW2HDR1_9MICO|nr:GNAT family N-acetyltransferase [Microbacterium fluvii]MCU4672890.1 GNAT family N-acetyltransferase [Microbacterium fluvii]